MIINYENIRFVVLEDEVSYIYGDYEYGLYYTATDDNINDLTLPQIEGALENLARFERASDDDLKKKPNSLRILMELYDELIHVRDELIHRRDRSRSDTSD